MYQQRLVSSVILLAMPLVYGPAVYAAKALNLSQQDISILKPIVSVIPSSAKSNLNVNLDLAETKRSVDFKNTLHIRFNETYLGYPVWGADGVLHIPNGANNNASLKNVVSQVGANSTMDGTLYQNLNADLANTSNIIFTQAQAQKALQEAINNYRAKKGGNVEITEQKNELIVFIADDQKAHWAFHVSFYASPTKSGEIPALPNIIMDASSFQVLVDWDNINTLEKTATFGGGFGGNKKMGQFIYDGLASNMPKLNIIRESLDETCYLQNVDVKVKKCTDFTWGQCRKSEDFKLACAKTDPDHNDIYWNGDMDKVNGGYSPSNDALFNGAVIKDLYLNWYGIPVLEQNGKPMLLTMVVHLPMDNAYWDGKTMNFGDGIDYFYPLTSLGVAAHEISHGFTQQHSNLRYYAQSGGMNEAFSDMAAQAAEMYAFKKNSWQIGPEIFKSENEALRYMDKPSKDCRGRKPGSRCSIDDASQYYSGLDVHYSSGVYNRLFYLLGTSQDWTVRKAFDVMVLANRNYWTSSSDFASGACGLIKAAKDLDYNVDDIRTALKTLKVEPTC